MAPKKKVELNKNEMKKAEKFVDDKTFGLKNKNKSKKVQDYVSNVKKVYTGKDEKEDELKRKEQKRQRDAKKEQEKELSDLFKAVISAPKLAFGEDPKSVLCPFFVAGQCAKGDKCKYSHDLTINTRKSAKKDIHTDHRDEEQETNADWDREKLEAVLLQKEGKRPQTTTKIVCRYFLDAIENECYGWFWQCPNGTECKYRHALPEGFIYKSKSEREMEAAMKEKDRATDKSYLRLENIETLRKQLPATNLTPVTPESFAKWKQERVARKKQEKDDAEKANEKKKVNSKQARLLSGRALFTFNPTLFVDDEAAADDREYEVVGAEEEEQNALEGREEVINIAEAAEAAAAEGGEEEEEVKISMTMFADEDLDDLPSEDEEEEEEEEGEKQGTQENDITPQNEPDIAVEESTEPT